MLQLASEHMTTKTRIKPTRAADISDLGIPVEVGEFWTSRAGLARCNWDPHGIHAYEDQDTHQT